jgi:hypothetical protein
VRPSDTVFGGNAVVGGRSGPSGVILLFGNVLRLAVAGVNMADQLVSAARDPSALAAETFDADDL